MDVFKKSNPSEHCHLIINDDDTQDYWLTNIIEVRNGNETATAAVKLMLPNINGLIKAHSIVKFSIIFEPNGSDTYVVGVIVPSKSIFHPNSNFISVNKDVYIEVYSE